MVSSKGEGSARSNHQVRKPGQPCPEPARRRVEFSRRLSERKRSINASEVMRLALRSSYPGDLSTTSRLQIVPGFPGVSPSSSAIQRLRVQPSLEQVAVRSHWCRASVILVSPMALDGPVHGAELTGGPSPTG